MIEHGRKLPREYDHPFDSYILYPFSYIDKILYKLHVTPNMLTTASTLFGILCIYALYHSRFLEASIYCALYYMFDCYDGYFARKYNMITEFGDYYDHVKDLLFIIAFSIVFLMNSNVSKDFKYIILFIFIGLSVLSLKYFGCQEKYHKTPTATTKSLLKWCADTSELSVLRFFSPTTLMTLLIVVLLYLHINNKHIPCELNFN